MTIEAATEVLAKLVGLQTLDARIAELDASLAKCPLTRAADAERLRAAKLEVESLEAKLEETELEHRRMEAVLGDADALARRLEGQSAKISSNHAYTVLLHEIEVAKTTASTAEDAILALLDTLDERRGQLATGRDALAKLRAEIDATEAQLQSEEASLGRKREATLAEKGRRAADVDKELLRQYQVAASKHVDCIAYLSNKNCSGCRIAIPASQCQVIRQSNAPASCPQCHRLIISQVLFEKASSEARSSSDIDG